jgi:two-component system sensor histidine kinase PilS (NtrC family)
MLDSKRLNWFIYLRIVVLTLFFVSTLSLKAYSPDILEDVSALGLFKLVLATYFFSFLSLSFIRYTNRFNQTLTYAQIVWDLLLVTILILLTGGISSPYSFLYFLSIITASILLARREAYYTASLCLILYGSILDLQFYGKLVPLGLSQFPSMDYGPGYIVYLIILNGVAFYLTAILAGHLAERARISEKALLEKVIDYEELERLNSSIVATIDSGLLTINNDGKIRVFNHYAEQLTGFTQQNSYDQLLVDVIPGLAPYAEELIYGCRGEFSYQSVNGDMLLAFKSVPFTDKDGSRLGVIVDFHDLTQLKQMEAELKKADRLAAIGELSARIAHEIRNPLAAISGSVQLIAQGKQVAEKDKKLLSIVMRETARLNELIHDFLAYARPVAPRKVPIILRQLLDDLSSLLYSDPLFAKVIILNQVPDNISLMFDLDQCKQVFLNLLMNAAEAASAEGEIRIAAELIKNTRYSAGDVVKITVMDNGRGMLSENSARIFEPFYSTKQGGSGLGLATVYRIIEAHGGVILVDSSVGIGTIFTMYVPV